MARMADMSRDAATWMIATASPAWDEEGEDLMGKPPARPRLHERPEIYCRFLASPRWYPPAIAASISSSGTMILPRPTAKAGLGFRSARARSLVRGCREKERPGWAWIRRGRFSLRIINVEPTQAFILSAAPHFLRREAKTQPHLGVDGARLRACLAVRRVDFHFTYPP